MSTFDVTTDVILSIMAKNNVTNTKQPLVSTKLNETLKFLDENGMVAESIHILNPKNLVFQPITIGKLLAVLNESGIYSQEDMNFLENHKFFTVTAGYARNVENGTTNKFLESMTPDERAEYSRRVENYPTSVVLESMTPDEREEYFAAMSS